jgi:hypothetical protein
MEPGPYIQTVTGRRFNPFEPDVELIDIGDVALALSHLCRFGGHCRVFYSVAQHSCLVSDQLALRGEDATTVLWGLLHDASEAYLGDMPHPVKHRSDLGRMYAAAEDGLQGAICARFELPVEPPPVVKQVDRGLLAAERKVLSQVAWTWPELEGVEPLELTIEPWHPERGRDEFLARFESIEAERRGAARAASR